MDGAPNRCGALLDDASGVQYTATFQQVVHSRGLDAVQAARLLVMGNLIGADSPRLGKTDPSNHL